MVLVKTQAGPEALKDRRGSLSSRQRSAFILFDRKRCTGEILAVTATMGITQEDVGAMIAQGLLAPLPGQSLPAASGTLHAATAEPAPATDLGTVASPLEGSGRSPNERATDPIATELTAGLGLRGFWLNLAVEGAGQLRGSGGAGTQDPRGGGGRQIQAAGRRVF